MAGRVPRAASNGALSEARKAPSRRAQVSPSSLLSYHAVLSILLSDSAIFRLTRIGTKAAVRSQRAALRVHSSMLRPDVLRWLHNRCRGTRTAAERRTGEPIHDDAGGCSTCILRTPTHRESSSRT